MLKLSQSDTQASDSFFDALRRKEYSRLDAGGHAYLDYTGSALYADHQILEHTAQLRSAVFGNPHSENGPSLTSTALIHQAKALVLSFLDASPRDYAVCFTANASAAIKLVAESYRFEPENGLLLSADNHNSMNGVREFARAASAPIRYLGLTDELRLRSPEGELERGRRDGFTLFGFPAQSNFSGVKHPLSLIEKAHALGYSVLLDAAAYLPTNPLSLTEVPADFVALSFYKILGYPTGVGALVARRDKLEQLRRPWFAGGTVDYASVQHDSHQLLDATAGGFEDGTPAFLSICALRPGLELLNGIGMTRLSSHVMRLTSYLISELTRLRRGDGRPLVKIHGPGDSRDRGATVAFNILDAHGRAIPFADVVDRARAAGVSLRGGCFCNPGASEAAFGFPFDATRRCLDAARRGGFSVEKFSKCLGPDIPVGAVRASLGIASNQRDIDRAIEVIGSFAGERRALAS
jgi:selenocysteine lyase/cysteine desulfurase